MVSVAAVPETTDAVPWFTPSMVKVTVPVAMAAPGDDSVRFAVTCRGAPGAGVLVAGTRANVVGPLETVMVTEVAVEPLLLVSPL